VILQNVGTLPYTNLTVRAIQEYHDTSTNVVKGQGMPGGSTNDWTAINVGAGAQVTLNDDYYIPSGTWPGYDQTHVIVKDAGLEIYDNDQAGIWCPPPQSLPPGGGGGSTNGMKGAGGGGLKRPEASFSLDSGQSLSATAYHLITVSTEPGLRYSIEFTDDLVPEPATWSPFASPEAGVWVESGDSPTTHTFVDDETAATSGSAPAAGHRYYRIKVDVP
jgi:hypothetical protein